MSINTLQRREFLKLCGAAALAGIPVTVRAQAPGKLSVDDPAALSLAYVEDASQVDPAANPRFREGADCGNCALYVTASEVDGFAPCRAVGGRLVARAGWCKVWVPG